MAGQATTTKKRHIIREIRNTASVFVPEPNINKQGERVFGFLVVWSENFRERMLRYFLDDVRDENGIPELPTIGQFCANEMVTPTTLKAWCDPKNAEKYPGMVEAWEIAQERQRTLVVTNGAKGVFNPTFTGLLLRVFNLLNKDEPQNTVINLFPALDNEQKLLLSQSVCVSAKDVTQKP